MWNNNLPLLPMYDKGSDSIHSTDTIEECETVYKSKESSDINITDSLPRKESVVTLKSNTESCEQCQESTGHITIPMEENDLDTRLQKLRHRYKSMQDLFKYSSGDTSDSDSDDDVETVLKNIGSDDIYWFSGLGFKLRIEDSLFFTQVVIALTVIGFSIYQIVIDPDNSSNYTSLISAVMGYFFAKANDVKKTKKS